jgi:hypothetical protein
MQRLQEAGGIRMLSRFARLEANQAGTPAHSRASPPAALPPLLQQNHNFIKAVTPHLVPVLLEQLTKQEEGQEQDESTWNLAMSSGTCLGLMARVAGNDVVPVVRGRGVGVGWTSCGE